MKRLLMVWMLLGMFGVAAAQEPAVDFIRDGARRQLVDNLLPFWLEHPFESRNDGFVGRINNDLTVDRYTPKNLSLTARLLWFYSAAYRFEENDDVLDAAERAAEYLEDYFFDDDEGGYFWRLHPSGQPLNRDKVLYGHAFMIYALSEYAMASDDEDVLEQVRDLFALVEEKFRDCESGQGYFETLSEEWERTGRAEELGGVPVGGKTMNSHLHLLEAYANLYRVWPDESVAVALGELIEVFLGPFYFADVKGFYQETDADWEPLSDRVSFGHDLEAVWLLCDAVDVLGDDALKQRVHERCLQVADQVLRIGIDEDGGVFNEGLDGAVVDRNKEWWPQAESMVGLVQSWQMSGEARYLQAASNLWKFIATNLVDEENGEWFKTLEQVGQSKGEKMSEWKGPYHNGRACLELIRRLK